MPYTPKPDQICRPYCEQPAKNVGDLTFQISTIVQMYLEEHGLRYQQIAEIKAALCGSYDDFNEVVVTPYEAKKREENGDIWAPLRKAGIIP